MRIFGKAEAISEDKTEETNNLEKNNDKEMDDLSNVMSKLDKIDISGKLDDLEDWIDKQMFGDEELEDDREDEIDSMMKPNSRYKDAEGNIYYTDDNGDTYRKNNDLLSNNTYVLNDYKYRTDDNGRIVHAEGQLKCKEDFGRKERKTINTDMNDIAKGDQRETDERGHIIGDNLNGSNGLGNLAAMDKSLNRGDYKQLETELSKAVKDGKNVYVKTDIKYEGDSHRPSAFIVTYTIDGEQRTRIFNNEGD